MMSNEDFETLLNFFRALGNESRLKIVGILANGERTVSELAEMLGLKEPTVSQHLMMLKQFGLVKVRPDKNFRYYSFNNKALIELSKGIFSHERLTSVASEEASNAYEAKILKTFLDGERIVQLPASEKKLLVVIKWLAGKFEEGVEYTEKQINEILTRYHEDYALLRRELVDCRYLARKNGAYWKLPVAHPSE